MMIERVWSYSAFLIITTLLSEGIADGFCPHRCYCVTSTVRCMSLHLDKIPHIPHGTVTLDLRFNRISEIPKDSFKGHHKLTTLLLNNNQLTRLEDGAFDGLTNLRYLYLYKNSIKVIEKNAFEGLINLSQIYLHSNQIETLEDGTFHNLPSLERLFLQNNRLQRLPVGAFQNITSLKRLRLDSNPIICDCQTVWLAEVLQSALQQTTVVCNQPESIRGKAIQSLLELQLQCKKPVLMEEPNDVDMVMGSSTTLKCKADGDPEPKIIWMHNNKEIVPGSFHSRRYHLLRDGSLKINDIQDSDEGVYECMAKNIMGEVKSKQIQMKAKYGKEVSSSYKEDKYLKRIKNHNSGGKKPKAAPKIILTPSDQRVREGSTVNLRCRVSGKPTPTVTWLHNNQPVSERYGNKLMTDLGDLTMQEVKMSDAGNYQCLAINPLGQAIATARVFIHVPPMVLEAPVDLILEAGERALFNCRVSGDPRPTITWIRKGLIINTNERIRIEDNGERLVIPSVDKSDQATYLCRVQNIGGTMDAGADLIINGRAAPSFVERPQNEAVISGKTVTFACSATGEPRPVIKWRKDGIPIEQLVSIRSNFRLNHDGTFQIDNVSDQDRGLYECRAENEVGIVTSAAFLSIIENTSPNNGGISDSELRASVERARHFVDKAVNDTLRLLFDKKNPPQGPADIMRLIRFPTSPSIQNAVRAAEVYERALTSVRRLVREGHNMNKSEDYYPPTPELSVENLYLMANLSGCLAHRRIIDCNSSMCFHSKYRTYDGACNNIQNPLWGSSETALKRLMKPVYENGFNTPIGWDKTRLYNGFLKPSGRVVSNDIVSTSNITGDANDTHMLMQWGQFLDHDLDLAPPTVSTSSFLDGADCRWTCDNAIPCFPIQTPANDPRIRSRRCMEFVRTSPVCGSGATSVLYGRIMVRDQLNVLTSYIDGSQVYGSSEAEAKFLREFRIGRNRDGFLRTGSLSSTNKPYLPFNDNWPVDCRRNLQESDIGCFVAGDVRVNEQLGLIAMHTVWFREHNRLATELRSMNPHWEAERIYQESRKIVGATMQHITYTHWLPKILGPSGMQSLGPYTGYNPDVDATISNAFATAAMRFGHTLINPILHRLDANFKPIPQGHVHLRNAFFSPFRIFEEGGIDPLLRGLFTVATKLKKPDQLVNSELTEQLFRQVNLVALDLAAINIQRGRDHGLPSYNQYRKWCNLTEARSFHDLRKDITNQQLRDKLETHYGHPDNVDLWVGGICEDVVPGAKVGPTFLCLLVDQFKRLRDGDRFYYENPTTFNAAQLREIKKSSLSRILCDNGDRIEQITLDSFTIASSQGGYTQCSNIPRENLNPWTDSEGCNLGSESRHRRSVNDDYDLQFEVKKLQSEVNFLNQKIHFLESQCSTARNYSSINPL
ncbi:hypothetical protein CHUAL_011705 [Chamberlinius hualienensis]